MARFTAFALLALFAAQGALAAPEPDAFFLVRSLVVDIPISRRQFTPPSVNTTGNSDCSSQCSDASNLANCDTSDISCFCNQKVIDSMVSCFDCALATDTTGSLTQSDLQQVTDQYVEGCNSLGQKVSSHTITASKDGLAGAASALTVSVVGVLACIAAAATMMV